MIAITDSALFLFSAPAEDPRLSPSSKRSAAHYSLLTKQTRDDVNVKWYIVYFTNGPAE